MKKMYRIRLLMMGLCLLFLGTGAYAQNAWINEIHYDNVGTDVGEFIEVVIENPSQYILSEFRVHLYNGSGGAMYSTESLSTFIVGSTVGNFTLYYYVYPSNGIQNGAPDGMALTYQNVLIPGQWLSYEGTMTATNGPAAGMLSVDIGVWEDGVTPIGHSLQLSGTGTQYSQFTWEWPAAETKGTLNNNQFLGSFTPDPEPTNFPTAFSAIATGVSITLSWNDATGSQLPSSYLILASDNSVIAPPVDGVPVPDDLNLGDGFGAKNVAYGAQTFTFHGLSAATSYYFAIYPYTNTGQYIDYKNTPAAPQAGALTAFIIEAIDFNDLTFGNWDTISLASDKNWFIDFFQGDTFAKISGFQGNEPSNDWLISPGLNLGSYSQVFLSFITAKNFTGPDMEVLISTNYTSGGIPSVASWAPLQASLSTGGWIWTHSGNISLSAYTGMAHIAFRYTSTATESATWEVDDIYITGFPAGMPVVVINEILADNVAAYLDPSNQAYDPWIELYNGGSSPVTLLNWSLSNQASGISPWHFPDTTIPAGGYLIVWADMDTADPGLHTHFLLDKQGGVVHLFNASNNPIDSVAYGPQGSDTSFARIPNGFGAFQYAMPTPMAFNSLFPFVYVDTIPPLVVNAYAVSTTEVKVIYNEAVGVSATNPANYSGLGAIQQATLAPSLDTVSLSLSTPLAAGQVYMLVINGVADTAGNIMAVSQTFPISYGPVNADLVITEIMYNPPEVGVDTLEYIEIYNRGNNMVNMNGFFFAEGVDYIFPSVILNPGAFIVVARSASAIFNVFGVSALEWTGGSLSNAGENIALHDNFNNLVNAVHYLDVAPWPTAPDGGGPSLVLCDPNLDNSNPLNWVASVEFVAVNANGDSIYGTPGGPCINSGIADNDGVAPSWTFYPNPASLTFMLNLKPGLWTLEIMDLMGRQIRSYTRLEDQAEISVANLETGVYLLKLIDHKGRSWGIRKIVKH